MNETRTQTAAMKYRPDIDGLRTVAVLSLLADNIWPWRITGGFIGVDVLFVISGYLISSILFSEIASNRFSVLAFYERRIRRIFPALFAMLSVFSAVISFFLLPNELIDYAKSVIAATTATSNFYFAHHSGYFEAPMSYPLLHIWSLAVGEQFYLTFPVFLLLAHRFFPRFLKHAVVLLFFASLVASILAVRHDQNTAFYMSYTRAWELLLGTIVSLRFFPRLPNAWLRNAVTLAGMALIAYSAVRYGPQTPFPGLAALAPCMGSALIIGAGESGRTLVARALSWRPVAFIGLISYSLYLWHWPVIILNDLGLFGMSVNLNGLLADNPHALWLQRSKGVTLLGISMLLAILSWRFVERPFRSSSSRRIERQPLFAFSSGVIVALIALSAMVISANGFPGRFPNRAVRVAAFRLPPDSMQGQLGDCAITTATNQSTVFEDSNCLHIDPNKATYLLLGDSHAYLLWKGLKESLPNSNVLLAAAWGCSPSVHHDAYQARFREVSQLCADMMDFVFQKYIPKHSIQTLLVNYRWIGKNLDGLASVITWAKAHGIRVVLFGPVAEYDTPLPRLLAYSIAWNKPRLAQQHLAPYSAVMDAQLQNLAENTWHVEYVSLFQATCESDRCVEYADDKNETPMLRDRDHLTEQGSQFLVRRLSRFGKLDWSQ
jgi:peptidoglycan/LPS O-acetylase OafA/YrhL